VKTEIKFTALMAVCMALASVSLAQPHSDTIPGSSGVKKLTSEDIASLMHWELQKLPVTSATEDATDFLRVAKEHEEELPPRFDLLSQELEANGLAGFSDDRSKAEYQKTWESIVKDTLEHSLNPAPTPVLQPSPSVYHTYQAIHAKPSVAATASADSASVAVGASAIGAFFLLFVMGFFYFLPSIVAGSRHHHNGGAVFVINFPRLDAHWLGCCVSMGIHHPCASSTSNGLYPEARWHVGGGTNSSTPF
jgi:hypothetical protein